MVGAISFIGLCADAGYLAAVVGGVPGNLAAAAVKVVFKYVPPEAVTVMLRLSGTALASVKRLMEDVARAPGASTISGAVEKAGAIIGQWNKVLQSPLSLSPADLGDAVDILTRKATRH